MTNNGQPKIDHGHYDRPEVRTYPVSVDKTLFISRPLNRVVLIRKDFRFNCDVISELLWIRTKFRENNLYSSESDDNSIWITELALNQTISMQNVTWNRLWLSTEFSLELSTDKVFRLKVFPDQYYRVWFLVPDRNNLIRGLFRKEMAWWEVTSGWEWNNEWSLSDESCLIRGHFRIGTVLLGVISGPGMVWSEVISVLDVMIKGHFSLGTVWSEVSSGW